MNTIKALQKFLAIAFIASLCVFNSGHAFSDEDWVLKFNIPVTIENAPEDVSAVMLRVWVKTSKGATIAEVDKPFSLDSSGNFEGTLTVEIYSKDLKGDILKADNYQVSLLCQSNKDPTWILAGHEWGPFLALPGTTLVNVVKGPLVDWSKSK